MLFTEYLIVLIKCQYKYPSYLGREKKVSQPSLAAEGKHSYALSQWALLTKCFFSFLLNYKRLSFLLSDEAKSKLYIRIKYALSTQKEHCIIYH